MWTDDPVADFERWDAKKQKELEALHLLRSEILINAQLIDDIYIKLKERKEKIWRKL